MTKIRGFTGCLYNTEKVKDLAAVVCPPYDVISASRQRHLSQLSPYNLINILLRQQIGNEDIYAQAGKLFTQWVRQGVLIQDVNETIYFYSQQYTIRGEKRTRLGFIARLFLDQQNSDTYGHEHTRLEPKEDRLQLLRSVKANLSPIFAVVADKNRIIHTVFQKHINQQKPLIEITDDEKVIHRLWRIDAPELVADIQNKMAQEKIFIADGHHRFEVACTYRDEQKTQPGFSQEHGANYLMCYFTHTDSPGLTILPIHRLVRLEEGFVLADFIAALKEHFDIEEVKDQVKFFFMMEKAGRTQSTIGFYKDKRFFLMRLKNIKIVDKLIPDRPPEYRLLDVCILNYIVLQKILGLAFDDKQRIAFDHNAEEIMARVDADGRNIGFILNSIKAQRIMQVALTGHKMPPKSTFFYPKVLSGLVINRHEE